MYVRCVDSHVIIISVEMLSSNPSDFLLDDTPICRLRGVIDIDVNLETRVEQRFQSLAGS
jgi:hypothetical protein